ncbi:MAG: EAL domain-containing protein, partial [Oscillospiraceae bacterium]
MQAYIARQPIFNSKQQVEGYELLYRDGISGNAAGVTDGGQATSRLLSDAITLFGLPQLTNFRPAYINFTKDLILNDFVLLTKPQEIVVELTEDIRVTNILLQKLQFLKDEGYVLALDNYSGEPAFDRLLPYADVLKVDFQSVTPRRQQEIGARHRGSSIALLAEKIETREEFCRAIDMGYELFQGYFFERPSLLSKRLPSLAASSCGRILRELREDKINFDACAEIIHSDAVLTYRIMQKIQTLQYYRGNVITALKAALVMLGAKEFRRWTLLLLARENNVTRS